MDIILTVLLGGHLGFVPFCLRFSIVFSTAFSIVLKGGLFMNGDIFAIVLILAFSMVSGFNDGGNLLANLVNSRVMSVSVALLMILFAVTVAPFLFGVSVARTIGTQIIHVNQVGIATLNIALLGTLVTLLICWKFRVPTSTSFALVGGMSGAALARFGVHAVVWSGLWKVVITLFLAVTLGSLGGFLLYSLVLTILRRVSIRTGESIGRLQYVSALLLCFGYGANDAEKSIGLLGAVWMLMGNSRFRIDWWMIVLSAIMFGLGLLIGGWRIAKTVGFHVFRTRPVHTFATQLGAAVVVLSAAMAGGPVSTTQTVDSALVGVGVRARKERIRWSVVRKLGVVWATTMPIAFVSSWIIAIMYDALGGLR